MTDERPEESASPIPTSAPGQQRLRLARAVLRDLTAGGTGLVARKTAAALRRGYQVSRYRWNPRRLVRSADDVRIDRPIFLLGTQGGGGTVLARCMHRHPRTVYASGNSDWWTGPDELHNTPHLMRDMPEPLLHRSYHFGTAGTGVEHHPLYGYQRSWLYAVDEFLPRYRRTAEDADTATAERFRRVIRNVILAYAHDPDDCRFVDKSQLYTIQVPYVARLLDGCDPHFVLIARNPYAACARAVAKEYGRERGGYLEGDLQARVRCAVEHWSNSYRLALESEGDVPLCCVRYEDFLADPPAVVRRICEFAGLEFHADQVPAAGQRVPLGGDSYKWYPLKPAENERYLRSIDRALVRALNDRAADVIERLGYELL
jgi:hypothetical protein